MIKLITSLKTYRLCNKEHFDYMTRVKDLVDSIGNKQLQVENDFHLFSKLYSEEDHLMKRTSVTPLTKEIEDSDVRRDDYLRGISLIVKAYFRSPVPENRIAAESMQKCMNKYGDLRPLPYEEETLLIDKFCKEMENETDMLEKLQLVDWVKALKSENETFKALILKRGQTYVAHTNMKSVRHLIDKAYKNLVTKIEVLSIMNKELKYKLFIDGLKKEADRFNVTFLQKEDEIGHRIRRKSSFETSHPETFY